MSKYRIKFKRQNAVICGVENWVILQEKRWWGWRTVSRWERNAGGYELALRYKKLLEAQDA